MIEINKNRVLLIYPSFPGENRIPDRPPLGLLTIAAPLIKQGMEVCILDERAIDNFDDRLRDELRKGPLCVGISSLSGRHIKGALRVSKLVKTISDIPVVWGGVHASIEPRSTIQHALVDIIVREDGEETFPKLLDCLRKSYTNLYNVPGIAFKENGNIVQTDSAEPAKIENLPLIPFHLINFKNYKSRGFWTHTSNLIIMETSRGCPFSCSFCTESVRKKKWRALEPERVINDIKEYIGKYNIREFTFIDDNFFGNIKRGEKIVELMIKEELGIRWYTNIRADYMARVNHKFVKQLEKSGCQCLTFGAESGSERILKMINKHATKGEVIRANRKLVPANITPHFVTIRGFPTETRKELIKTYQLNIQLLLENKKAICDTPFLITTPGTSLAKQCLQDKTDQYTLEDWSKIFDAASGKRPDWALEETFNFIKQNKKLVTAISQANRIENSKWCNIKLRLYLRWARFWLKLTN